MKRDVLLCSGKRTPFGDFGRSLKEMEGTKIAVHAARACLDANNLDASKVDHLVCGNVIPVDQGGLFSSRVIALESRCAKTARH